MNQSPPKAKPKDPSKDHAKDPSKARVSSRPPAGAANSARLTTALAAGGSVLVLSTIAVVLWPRTYGTEATFQLDGSPALNNPSALVSRIEAALLERQELSGVATELPPELRAPDPIGRLRAGIRVQSHGGLAFGIEFRGSDQQSVQRIANRLADRAVALLPQLAASPQDKEPELRLAERTRAVTEFLTAHPEVSLESGGAKPSAAADSGLEALRTEKRQIEQRLSTAAADNPYTDPGQNPEILNRRLTEIKTTIARRERALREPQPATPAAPATSELVTQWRALLADLATAQAAASVPATTPPITGHITARAPLPSSPLTPNRLVLSVVAALLSAAAAMAAYALPRFAEPEKRKPHQPPAPKSSDPPLGAHPSSHPPPGAHPSSHPPPGAHPSSHPPPGAHPSSHPPAAAASSDAPPRASDPFLATRPSSDAPLPRPSGSEPPGPIAAQRTVVLSGPSGAAASAQPAHRAKVATTSPEPPRPAATNSVPPAPPTAHSPPAAPLFGSRPPPGAGSYSVSSSHPPAMDPRNVGARTSVERLSPLQSAHPPLSQAAPPSRRGISPVPQANGPQIVSLPPALDPQAETWAARFETPPPPAPDAEAPTASVAAASTDKAAASPESSAPETAPKRGRWKTQVMGSMVPLEVLAAREERPEPSERPESVPPQRQASLVAQPLVQHSAGQGSFAYNAEPVNRQAPTPMGSTLIQQDMPFGWRPNVDAPSAEILPLRDAILKEVSTRRMTVLVTGSASTVRAQFASALALAVSESGARVLLVEADFDSPALHHALAFAAPAGAGFSQQLMARRNARRPEPWVVMRCSVNLQVLGEGRFRSPGLVGTREFEGAIQELREQYHAVIIHAPALARVDDLRPLGPLAQGVVVVRNGQPAQAHFGQDALRAVM